MALLAAFVLASRSVGAASVTPLPPVIDAGSRLGLDDVLPGSPPGAATSWAQLALNAGARLNRWEFRWDRIEVRRGAWSFRADDPAVAASQSTGLGIEGILIGTPAWAAAHGQPPGNGVPKGLYRPYYSARNFWAVYVRHTVEHYRGLVGWWEIWNEPDLGFFWNGTAADYYRLVQVASQVIHHVDPAAHVVLAGMVVPDMNFLSAVLSRVSGGHGTLFDVAAWHAYGDAASVYSNIQRMRALLNAHGFTSKPIWVTEDGFPASNPNGEQRQATYVFESILYALAAGAARVLVYRASDDTSGKSWGLLNGAGSPRMGYVTFQLAARYLSNATTIVHAPSANVERFTLYSPNQRVTVLWGHGVTAHSVTLSAATSSPTIVTENGEAAAAAAPTGRLALVVPGATYNAGIDPKGAVVGGAPLLVVENNATPSGLGSDAYLPPLPGAGRRVVLFNPGGAAATVQVAAAGAPDEHEVIDVPANSVRSVDLDLLAGTSYTGDYVLSSTAPVVEWGDSSAASVEAIAPALQWYLPSAPPLLSLTNPSSGTASAIITALGTSGRTLVHSHVTIAPGSTATWHPPSVLRSHHAALRVTADVPMAVWSAQPDGATPLTSQSWYVIHPATGRVPLFNPGPAPATITVSYIASPALTGAQLQLLPGHSYALPSGSAGAIAIASSGAIAVGSPAESGAGPQLAAAAATHEALVVGGAETQLLLLNPGPQAVHANYTLVMPGGTKTGQATVPPEGLLSIGIRHTWDGAAGVTLSADGPIVAAAG